MLIKTIALIISSMFIWVIGNLVDNDDKQLNKIMMYVSCGASSALLVTAIIVMMQHGYNTIVLPNMLQYYFGNQIKVI